MDKFQKTNCLICSSNEYYPYSTKGQFGVTTNVVICKNCGFSYLNPRWTKERYHSYYTKEYDTHYRKYSAPFKTMEDIVFRSSNVIDYTSEGINILDIGAGMGNSLLYVKQTLNPNASFFAIEASEHCINNLKTNKINVITNDVDTDWHIEYKEKFDIIIMRHVLEHLLNPADVLRKVRQVLKPNGVFYVAVPNSKIPTKPLLNHFFRVVHTSYFSVLSFTNILKLTGLNPIKIVEGDNLEDKEIFAFCKKTVEENIVPDKNEWKVQKKIYDSYRRLELYYRFRYFVEKKIILRFK